MAMQRSEFKMALRRTMGRFGLQDYSIFQVIDGISESKAKEREAEAPGIVRKQRRLEREDAEDQDRKAQLREQRRLVWKCDRHILPVLCWFYLLTCLDKMVIGNARIQGLEEDLHLTENQFNIAVSIFLIPYIIFELPSNLFLARIPPSLWMSGSAVLWGATTICMALVQSYGQLLCLRFFLGLFEAGFVPGSVYLISMYYKRNEIQWRFSIFYTAAIMSGSVGGFISWGVEKTKMAVGLHSWRWIFIISGLITILSGIASMFLLPDEPEKAKFLSDYEQDLIQKRLKQDDTTDSDTKPIDCQTICSVLCDRKIWVMSLLDFACANSAYGIGIFAPTIIKDFGWSVSKTQIMTIPPCLSISLLGLIVAWVSDKCKHKYTFVFLGCLLSTGAYIALIVPGVSLCRRYIALIFAGMGSVIAHALSVGWAINNFGGRRRKNVAAALMLSVGNCGGFVASNVFVNKDGPQYVIGFSVTAGLMSMATILSVVYFVSIWRENNHRIRGGRDYRYSLCEDELQDLGEGHPKFRFSY